MPDTSEQKDEADIEFDREVDEIIGLLNPVMLNRPIGACVEAAYRFLVMTHIATFETADEALAALDDLHLDGRDDIIVNFEWGHKRAEELKAEHAARQTERAK